MEKLRGRSVLVTDGNVDKALRKFKKKIQTSGILDDVRAKEFYEKPTIARKKAAGAARSRWLRKLQSEALPKKMY